MSKKDTVMVKVRGYTSIGNVVESEFPMPVAPLAFETHPAVAHEIERLQEELDLYQRAHAHEKVERAALEQQLATERAKIAQLTTLLECSSRIIQQQYAAYQQWAKEAGAASAIDRGVEKLLHEIEAAGVKRR